MDSLLCFCRHLSRRFMSHRNHKAVQKSGSFSLTEIPQAHGFGHHMFNLLAPKSTGALNSQAGLKPLFLPHSCSPKKIKKVYKRTHNYYVKGCERPYLRGKSCVVSIAEARLCILFAAGKEDQNCEPTTRGLTIQHGLTHWFLQKGLEIWASYALGVQKNMC